MNTVPYCVLRLPLASAVFAAAAPCASPPAVIRLAPAPRVLACRVAAVIRPSLAAFARRHCDLFVVIVIVVVVIIIIAIIVIISSNNIIVYIIIAT